MKLGFHRFNKGRELFLDHRPEQFHLNPMVLMRDDIAQSRQPSPINRRMAILDLCGNSLNRFTHFREGVLDRAIGFSVLGWEPKEGIKIQTIRILYYVLCGPQDFVKKFGRVSHD